VSVKHVSAPGSHSSTHLHRSDLLHEPQHDLETFHSSYSNFTGTVGTGGNHLNTVTGGNAVHSGRAGSVEGVVRHQLSSAGFSATGLSVSSISGGVVIDAFPCPAIALTPWPVSSCGQILGSDSVMTATAVEVLKRPEPDHSMSPSHTMILDHGRRLALGPSRVQAGGKTSAAVASKASDIYEFRDEDDSEFAGMSIGFRSGKLSGSATCPPRTSHISLQNNSQPISVGDATKRCHTASETRAGTTSAPQNVAMIFDMDSKSIHRISLPVKHEPLYLNVAPSNSAPLTVMDETLSRVKPSPQNDAQRRKHSLPSNDTSHKRARLNSTTSSYLNFENGGSNNHLPPHIQDLISNVRKMNSRGSGSSAFDNWPDSSRLPQPVNSTLGLQPLSFETVTCPDRTTYGYMAVKPVDVPIRSSVSNASCSEVMKYKNEPFSSVLTGRFSVAMRSSKSPYVRSVNKNVAGATNDMSSINAIKPVPVIEKSMYPVYAGSEYYVHQQNRMAVSQQPNSHVKDRNKYESDIKWLHAAKMDHSSAVQSTYLEQNTSRNVSLEGSKKRDIVSESSQQDALSYVLDLSCTDSQWSASHVTPGHSFHPDLSPAAAASRYSDNKARQIVTAGLPHRLPFGDYSHHQLQQQKQLALNVKKEDMGETKMMTDEEKLADRLKRNTIEEAPQCRCRGLMLIVNNLSSLLSDLSIVT